jgi:pyruvate kinase
MTMPANKTKIVCTIGPACQSQAVMERMILAGMNVARLNFSHGDCESHSQVIENLRAAATTTGKRLAIMADLPGPKIRIGQFEREPIELLSEDHFTLTTEDIVGNKDRVSVTFEDLPRVVSRGHLLFLNDGLVQLKVQNVSGRHVHCRVLVGGELLSRKGLNLPGIKLGIQAFTDKDHAWLKFAANHELDAISQSFVETADDIEAVRSAASALRYYPLIIAKIERSRALEHVDDILKASDGIMVARGDLGVEIPIEGIAMVQKRLTQKANIVGKPVITATQMLLSMTGNRRPTRAESTDAANAILDGTDCVMLSEESAVGQYPVEAVTMLSAISMATEPHLLERSIQERFRRPSEQEEISIRDIICHSVRSAVDRVCPALIIAPTKSGVTARRITRFRLPVWIAGISRHRHTCQQLQFSYGVYPHYEKEHPENWRSFAGEFLKSQGLNGDIVILTERPSAKHPRGNNRMEILDLKRE